jgi:hypothetical protein
MELSQHALDTLKEVAENPYAVLSQRANADAIEELLPTGLIEYNPKHDWYEVSAYGFEMAREAGWDCGWWFGLQWVRMAA